MSQVRQERGRKARHRGRRAEYWAALWLILKGYRILGFRLRTPTAELDILAYHRACVIVVEVKHRASLDQALEAVSDEQRQRIASAARTLVSRRKGLKNAAIRLDLMALTHGHWPRHLKDAWAGDYEQA